MRGSVILSALVVSVVACHAPPAPPRPVVPGVAPAKPAVAAPEIAAPLPNVQIRARTATRQSHATFSADGRFLVQGPIVREVASGDVVRTFEGLGSATAISPDGKTFVVGDVEKASLYAMGNGERLRTFDFSAAAKVAPNAEKAVTRLMFTPDGASVIAYLSHAIVVQPVSGGAPRVVMSSCSTHEEACGRVTADGKLAVEPSYDEKLAVTDLATGKVVRHVPTSHNREIAYFETSGSRAVSFSHDGTVGIFDIDSGKRLKNMTVSPLVVSHVTAGSGETGVVADPTEYALSVTLSPDGKKLVTVAAPDGDKTPVVRVWDIARGVVEHRLTPPAYVSDASVSPDGKTMALSGPSAVFLYDLPSKRYTRHIEDVAGAVGAVGAAASGDYAATASGEEVSVWDMHRLKLVRTIRVRPLTKAPPNRWGNQVTALGFSADGQRLAVGTYAGVTLLLETSTGRLLRELTPVYRGEAEKGGSHWLAVNRLTFSKDGAYLVAGQKSKNTVVHDAESGKIVGVPALPKAVAAELAPAFAEAVTDDVPTLAQYRGIKKGVVLARRAEARVEVCDAGLCFVSRGGTTATALPAASLSGVAILGADRAMIGAADGTVRLLREGRKDALTMVGAGDDWALLSEDGLFDASPRGDRLLYVIEGDHSVGIDQVAAFNNRGDVLIERFGESPADVARLRAQHLRRAQKKGLGTAPPGAAPEARIVSTKQRGAEITIEAELTVAEGSRDELEGYRVYVDNVAIEGASKGVSGKRARLTETFAVTRAVSKIEVEAIAKGGRTSARALAITETPPATARDLWFIGFGVSAYREPALALGSAHKDAQDLGAHFRKAARGYGSAHVKVLRDAEVSRDAAAQAKAFLAGARPADTVVLFIAGHGVHDRDAAQTYYFLPHDVNPKDLPGSAVPFEAFEDALASTPARTRVFLMDTCQSGEAEEDARAVTSLPGARVRGARGLVFAPAPRRSAPDKDRFAFVDLARRAGAVVLSSSHGGEPSLEDEALGHGLFTSALLSALSKKGADTDQNGALSRRELFAYVRESVARASGGVQNPTIDRDNLAIDIDLPVAP